MKTIKISDESYAFLKDLMHKCNTQNNRSGALPVYFVIREDRMLMCSEEYTDDYIWLDDESQEIVSAKDVANGNETEILRDWLEENWDSEYDGHVDFESLSESEIEDMAEDEQGARKESIQIIRKYSKVFLTEDACENYIENNKHNLSNPVSYGESFYDNYEFKALFKALAEIIPNKENSILKRNIQELEFTSRATNVLLNNNIIYFGQLLKKTKGELLNLEGFGRGCLYDVENALEGLGYFLKYKKEIEKNL